MNVHGLFHFIFSSLYYFESLLCLPQYFAADVLP